MKRREFIAGTAGLIGAALPGVGRVQSKPCPPPTLQVSGGTSVSTACGTPAWLQGHGLNEWFEIPGTNLSSVEPIVDSLQHGGTGPESKIVAWCGAALRRSGSLYILGACGGHGDYAGNEVDAIALNADAPSWVELRGPSASKDLINYSECYLDGRRSAAHTYCSQQFCDSLNALIMMPDPGMYSEALPNPPSGWPYSGKRPMAFSLATNDWLSPETHAPMPLSSGSDYLSPLATTDHATGDIYYARSGDGKLWRFSPSSGSWTSVGSYSHSNYSAAAIDPVRQRMLVVGDWSGTVAPRMLDIRNAAQVAVTFTGLGADVLKFDGYPGAVFDESNDRFLVFKNTTPITCYAVSPVNSTTWNVSTLATTGAPAARRNGIHNSVQFVPELKGLVIATSYSGNMHFMRLA